MIPNLRNMSVIRDRVQRAASIWRTVRRWDVDVCSDKTITDVVAKNEREFGRVYRFANIRSYWAWVPMKNYTMESSFFRAPTRDMIR
jgi:hypothetical protein